MISSFHKIIYPTFIKSDAGFCPTCTAALKNFWEYPAVWVKDSGYLGPFRSFILEKPGEASSLNNNIIGYFDKIHTMRELCNAFGQPLPSVLLFPDGKDLDKENRIFLGTEQFFLGYECGGINEKSGNNIIIYNDEGTEEPVEPKESLRGLEKCVVNCILLDNKKTGISELKYRRTMGWFAYEGYLVNPLLGKKIIEKMQMEKK